MLSIVSYGQRPTIELTFTAIDSAAYVRLDSIRIMNRTQGDEMVLHWPDTAVELQIDTGDLLLYVGYATFPNVGIEDPNLNIPSFKLLQNYPNPITDHGLITMYIPEKGTVSTMVTDVQGRIVASLDRQMDQGVHYVRFSPCHGSLYLVTAQWHGMKQSIKIVSVAPNTGKSCKLEYIGSGKRDLSMKVSPPPGNIIKQSGILDSPATDKSYTFQFATNIPCPGTPTLYYEGQVYNTIQIFSQCWLRENLNAGVMITDMNPMGNNDVIQKFCYNGQPHNCDLYGGIYPWYMMMQYTSREGARGICPYGWHIPSDEEWKLMEGSVDSQYGIGDPQWDNFGWRGFDDGTNLKAIHDWYNEGNGIDMFGFSGLPGGTRNFNTLFYDIGKYGYWWTSTEIDSDNSWYYNLGYNMTQTSRSGSDKINRFSVRCLRDAGYMTTPIELTFTATDNGTYRQLDSIKIINRTHKESTTLIWPDTTVVLKDEVPFEWGDILLYIGYSSTLQSGIIDMPDSSRTCTLQFATNIPCPETPIVEYEGQIYNTIQIFGQCWLRENLNVGIMIPVTQQQSDNGIIEKYCYNNKPDSCSKYGGLYQWDEMVQYTMQPGARGICPDGWHLPTDEEWKVLEGAVDSQYHIGDPEWDAINASYGYDAGKNLKTTYGWFQNGNGTNLYGFSALPGGYGNINGFFSGGSEGWWWTSTRNDFHSFWARGLVTGNPEVFQGYETPQTGFSVRCLRDD